MRSMIDLDPVHRPLAALVDEQLEQVSLIFERQLASDLTAVNTLCLHIEKYRGKMLRPTLVLLSGLAAGGADDASVLSEKHRILAAVTEMIHMATLVHDDVLDEADVRRNGATVNHLWGNESAVMLGDYLISNAFHLCSSMGDPEINLALGQITNTLCEGELVQLHHRDDYGMDEATYLDIVYRKTASLIGECCRLGAVLSLRTETDAARMAEPEAGAANRRRQSDHADHAGIAAALQRFGTSLGVAFQLQDDLLDLVGEQTVVGKSLGKDLDKGKLTLPVVHFMASADERSRDEVLRLIKHRDSAGLRERLVESGAVDSAQRVAQRCVEHGRAELAHLPPGPAINLLERLAEHVIDRAR